MKKTKRTVAETTVAFASAFPRHPKQDELLASAIELRAAELAQAPGQTKPGSEAKAKAEFKEALQATIYPPSERRFYCIWSRHPEAMRLAACINEVWLSRPGHYGAVPPQHWHAKKT
ncbi:hypothetical protein DLM45_06500 [Hyphomicrobium methylovorum]|uniref:hypothetical protein n=1 Tax=Hyphomicrobium methylovorum TaxID=84 RepID=UPI0015E75F3B|nr:hypothetical protein [Hyphomicrobium methylovorum]MBA2125872.1 hypothetical protein [Hyphomicrobium methylovorum]